MAASLSRPDPSSPASVAEAGFSTSRRGFSQDEVRAFLTSVAAELGRLQERERQLEARLRDAEAEAAAVPAPELDDETVAALLGEETLRVLQTARESASQIKIRAEETAAKILNDANDEVNRLRQESEVEAARKRHDATSDAEAEVALAKQQGREMVNEARAYRERVLADLERRTKLARQQIEDLVHGRDRLLQVFERARLVAVDVTSELQSVEGPAEFVNFSPTTGPLPLMVPASDMDRDQAGPASEPVDLDAQERAVDEFHDDDVDEAATNTPTGAVDATESVETVETDETDDDTDDDAAIGEADDTIPIETDGSHETAGDEAPAPVPPRDANVVSLFRGRPDQHTDAADDDDAESDVAESDVDAARQADGSDQESATDERPDVGGIFERLRSEAPALTDETTDIDDIDDVGAELDAEAAADVGADDDPGVAEATAFMRRDEALVPLIVGGARKLKRVLADEQNGVLDRLRQKQAVTQLDQLIADVDDHVDTYLGALADELLDAAIAGAAEVGKRDSKTLRTTITKGGALERAHAVVRDDLVAPLRARLERAISDGGGDNEDVTKRVRAVYREWKTQHIDDQLDDAFRFAHGGGLAAGVKPGTMLTWIIDPSESTCADCEDNSLAGEVAAGDAYPTGHVAAPAHAGCRCLTVPSGQ
ncbi:MAG: DivIVA domain-containing protein [Ilumatobacteraceae bacterium]|nr:DivIVA domain-containing protein [Ilumatobacteraceae bacterium]